MQTQKLRTLTFKAFRGLPDTGLDFKGRNFLLCGANGSGKSACVDGIEFLFSGGLRRFTGEGTAEIDAQDAIRHVCGGSAVVEAELCPSRATIRRELGKGAAPVCSTDDADAMEYVSLHPPVASFILRRSQLLGFIEAPSTKRLGMLSQLLGLDRLEKLGVAFADAEKQARTAEVEAINRQQGMLTELGRQLGGRNFPTWQEIEPYLAAKLKGLGIQGFKLSQVNTAIQQLASRGTEATAQLDAALCDVIRGITPPESPSGTQGIEGVNSAHEELREKDTLLREEALLGDGLRLLAGATDRTTCPLCEQPLSDGYEALLARIQERAETLAGLRKTRKTGQALLEALRRAVGSWSSRLTTAYNASENVLDAELRSRLCVVHEGVADADTKLAQFELGSTASLPINVSEVARWTRELHELAALLERERESLSAGSIAEVQLVLAQLKYVEEKLPVLVKTEKECARLKDVPDRAKVARGAFTSAREAALHKLLATIAERALGYYKFLHGAGPGQTECADGRLELTGRSKTGGLKLIVDFFGEKECDPRAVLSEGHLDSLGLAIYLACSRLFSAPGTLLILDDVLTSIDAEHKGRVKELLLEKFTDFQLVLTTHDRAWAESFKQAVATLGRTGEWCFKDFYSWDLKVGPDQREGNQSWAFIDANLTDPEFREIGGALRSVLESFLRRFASARGLLMPFRDDGRYTTGDFVNANVEMKIGEVLKKNADAAGQAEVDEALVRAFDKSVVNALSHGDERRFECSFADTKNFVDGLRTLKARAEKIGALKKRR